MTVVIVGGGCRSKNQTDELLSYGLSMMEDGEYESARDTFRELALVNSNSVTVHYNLGVAYWKLGDTKAAVTALTKAAELSDNDSRPVEMLAYVLLDSGKALEANKVLAAIDVQTPETLTLMARAAKEAGSSDLAMSFLGKALEMDADYPPALYNLALLYRDIDKNSREALIHYKHFRTVAPHNIHADESLAAFIKRDLSQEEENLTEPTAEETSIEPLGSDIDSNKKNIPGGSDPSVTAITEKVNSILLKADLELSRDNADTALIMLKDAVSKYPDSANAVWALAEIYDKNLGNQKKADEFYKKFALMFPKDPRAAGIIKTDEEPVVKPITTVQASPQVKTSGDEYFREGLSLYNKKQYSEAISAYKKALKLKPRSAQVAYNLGLAYKAKKSLSNASKAFTLAVKYEPDKPNALYMLGLTEKERGHNDAALTHLNRLIRTNPDFAEAHYLLGIIYRESNRQDMTAVHFERYIRLHPAGRIADQARAWLKKYKGNRR
jgi:tetratricopeptide (TPR) repeat protein